MGAPGGTTKVESGPAPVLTRLVHTDRDVMRPSALAESDKDFYQGYKRDDFGHGVSFGQWQFNQKFGSLGIVLRRMYEADPALFVKLTYGDNPQHKSPDKLARQLLDQLRDPNQRMTGSLSKTLNTEPWKKRLQRLGAEKKFQPVQDQVAGEMYLTPAKALAREFGLKSERGLAMMYDLCLQAGPTRSRKINGKEEPAGGRAVVVAATKEHARTYKAMLEASAADRAQRELDFLVALAKTRTRLMSERHRPGMRWRNEQLFASKFVSDAPTTLLLDKPQGKSLQIASAATGATASKERAPQGARPSKP